MQPSIPSESECFELLSELNLPSGLINHSVAVKNFALDIADQLEQRGIIVNRPLITAATLLHDVMKMDAEVCHGMEGGDFLRKRGFPEVAAVVEKHCLNNLQDPEFVPKTAEEKLLMYSDLRINAGQVVSLQERFDYIRQRYRPKDAGNFGEYMAFAKQLEWELLGKTEKK